MKKRYTEERIIGFLREADAGVPIVELCRRHGFSEASFYLWRNKFGVLPAAGATQDRGRGRCRRPPGLTDPWRHYAEFSFSSGLTTSRRMSVATWA